MKSKKRSVLTPSRVAAWATALLMMVGAAISFGLYNQSLYRPLLLLGLLQLFPAVIDLLLFLPILAKRTQNTAQPTPEQASEEPSTEGSKRFAVWLKAQGARAGRWCYDFWAEHRSMLVAALVLIAVLIFGVQYVQRYNEPGGPGLLTYFIPVMLVVLFVLYIVLDKWCKHTAAAIKDADEGEDTPESRAAVFDRAVLNSLRGGLSVARLGIVFAAAIIMLRMLKLVYWDAASGVVITALFFYELIFLVISLSVRVIRHEMGTSPELTVPMPGLGGEDLGILAYLEKNTGITMRSLWSIRLVGKIVPYAAMGIVLLLWGSSGIVKIEANQQGALYRLGKLQNEALEPGIHMTLPWPFDSVEVYDTEVVNQITVGYISDESADNIWTQSHGTEEYRLLLGNGHELVSINMRIEFVIEDLHTYLTGSAAPESLMQAAAYELITAKTINTDLATLLTADRVTFVAEFKQELIEHTKNYKTGLGIVNVVLESIHPPVEIADIYQEIVNCKIEAQRIITSAEGEAQVQIIQAAMNRDSTIMDALTMQAIDVTDAKASVAEMMGQIAAYEEYGKAYEYYLRVNAWRDAYSKGKLVIDGVGLSREEINAILVLLGVLSSK